MDPVKVVPARTDDNLIVAAFNIQWLGQLTHDVDKLSTVIQHFDVCGVLEIKAEKELPRLAKSLNTLTSSDWGYVFGTRTKRPGGRYYEAFGFLFRTDRVQLGNGIISNIWDKSETYRNDPFVASFHRKQFDFSMALLHTRWSSDSAGNREEEIKGIAKQIEWMKKFVPQEDLLVAGDFNYSGDDPVMTQMESDANLRRLDNNAKSTFKSNGSGFASSYDHIYVGDEGKTTIARQIGTATTLDTCHMVYGDNDPANMLLAKSEISDHLPVIAQFKVT